MLQKVRMLKTQIAVNDGDIRPVPFIEGGEYDVGTELLQSFIEMGAVELVEEKSHADTPSNKMHKAAPQNKARKPV